MLDWSKLKAFADDKINVNQILKFVLERVKNIVGKGEKAGHQYFLLSPQCFPKVYFSRSLEFWIVWERVRGRNHLLSFIEIVIHNYSITCIQRPLKGSNGSGLTAGGLIGSFKKACCIRSGLLKQVVS